MTSFDAVLFDFGGVFTPSPFELADELDSAGAREGVPLRELIFGPYDRDTDHPWHCLERGEITLDEARSRIIALGRAEGVDTDPFRLFRRLAREGGSGPRAAFVDRARALRKAGYRTGLVTNNAREFRDGWRRMVPVDELFEVIVDSSEVGVRKPDRRIFELALERLDGIAPERAMFLDDHPGNVSAAELIGIRGVLVESDPSAALAALDALLPEPLDHR